MMLALVNLLFRWLLLNESSGLFTDVGYLAFNFFF